MPRSTARETVLSVIAPFADQRLVLALRSGHEKPIVLRTETFSADVGWFTQQVLEMTRQELNGLKSVLGIHLPNACSHAVAAVEESAEAEPQLLSFSALRTKRA